MCSSSELEKSPDTVFFCDTGYCGDQVALILHACITAAIFNLLPFLQEGKGHAYQVNMLCVCVCPFKLRKWLTILIEFDMNLTPMEATPASYF
jgi:hypothetical protein